MLHLNLPLGVTNEGREAIKPISGAVVGDSNLQDRGVAHYLLSLLFSLVSLPLFFILVYFIKNHKKLFALLLLAATTMRTYKSNRPCDYVSFDGELCPWHGLPGKKLDLWFQVAPTRPQTWEDVQTIIIESKSNIEDDTTILLNSHEIYFDNCSLS